MQQSRIAGSFSWPFRGRWKRAWAVGLPLVLLSPLVLPVIPLLGYAVEATRVAERDPAAGPPAWRLDDRLFREGFAMFAAILVTWLPFAVLFSAISHAVVSAGILPRPDSVVTALESNVVAALIIDLPAGLLALLWLPHATARFAASGRVRDLFDVGAVLRGVRHDFATWNLVTAVIVTGWAVGLACAGLLCVGLVPGVYYAILVSAHAAATLKPKDPSLAAR